MKSKFRIGILGMGGVGGFLGGKLAAHFSNADEVETIFIARGENEKAIRENGLKLITQEGEQIVQPSMVTSDPGKIGLVNLIVCTVKSYDLEASLELLRPGVNEQTIILPFLNGVDATERIQKLFPQVEVWVGCVYIVSRLIAPGVVKESGNINKFYFGSASGSREKPAQVETIFKSAGINVQLSENILQNLWEKFLFISPLATLTSYLNLNIGDILSNEGHSQLMLQLITEVKSVADAAGISLVENIVQKLWDRMHSLSYETTSSMHDDFQRGHKTELDSLTGYVVKLGNELKVLTPYYEKMLIGLREKTK
jgi:2-dehydropantoate 2-reductase